MKLKLLNALVIVTSLLGYLEWGGDNGAFLFQAELEVLGKLITDPVSAAHPLTLLPLFGQILLLVTLFQRQPGKWLTLTGLACIGLLLFFMFIIGLMSFNFNILLSTLPFLVTSTLATMEVRKG